MTKKINFKLTKYKNVKSILDYILKNIINTLYILEYKEIILECLIISTPMRMRGDNRFYHKMMEWMMEKAELGSWSL